MENGGLGTVPASVPSGPADQNRVPRLNLSILALEGIRNVLHQFHQKMVPDCRSYGSDFSKTHRVRRDPRGTVDVRGG